MQNRQTILVTAAIPYVNAAPHIGHAQEYVEADVLARYYRLMGNDVLFVCGTDDNATKNVIKAQEAHEPVEKFVERHATVFKTLLAQLEISNDDFIRTSTDPRHVAGARKLWTSFTEGDLYKKTYSGTYCIGCEEFKLPKDLVDDMCPEHSNVAPDEVTEENYFFKLSTYQERLVDLLESDAVRVQPATRKNEVLAFVKSGLKDLSVSRSKERTQGWGIEVPGDSEQVMYVWVDALSNYINALDYGTNGELFRKYWFNADRMIHVIGKGISRFHTVYWPAFLLSASERPPTDVYVHGYLTVDGQKMSKSLGNVIDPFELLDEYGTEAFRYFFTREISPFEDSDVTRERFHEAYTANLVNGLGNLVSRVMKLAETHLSEAVGRPQQSGFPEEYARAVENYEFTVAMDYIWKRIGEADERMTTEAPFKVVKTDLEEGKRIIRELVLELYAIARMLKPFMPATSTYIKATILVNQKPDNMFPRKDAK